MSSPRIALLGAGNLASAIVRGMLTAKACAPADLACTGKSGATAQMLAVETGIAHEPDLARLLAPADVVIVAFKPQSLASADPRLADLTLSWSGVEGTFPEHPDVTGSATPTATC